MRLAIVIALGPSLALAAMPATPVQQPLGQPATMQPQMHAILRRANLAPRKGPPAPYEQVKAVFGTNPNADPAHPFTMSSTPYTPSQLAARTQNSFVAGFWGARVSSGSYQNKVKRVLRALERTSTAAGAPSLASRIKATLVVQGKSGFASTVNAESLSNGTIVVTARELKDAKAVGRLLSTHPDKNAFVDGLLRYASSRSVPKGGNPQDAQRATKGYLGMLLGHESTHSFDGDSTRPSTADGNVAGTQQVAIESRADSGGASLATTAGLSVSGALGLEALMVARQTVAADGGGQPYMGGWASRTVFSNQPDGDHPGNFSRYASVYSQIAARPDLSLQQRAELAAMPTPLELEQAITARMMAGTVPR